MSYNQTNKIHNPFEGEELEKGRFNMGKVEKQIGEAMGIIDKSSKALYATQRELRKASNMVDGAGNLVEVLQLARHVAPKRSRSGDEATARRIARDLKRLAKNIEKLDESIPLMDSIDFNATLAMALIEVRRFNKK